MKKVATKEKNYGEVVNTLGEQGTINFITFIDQGAVWMMSTVHDTANEPPCWRPIQKRPTASTLLARTTTEGDIELPYPKVSHDYNHEMNGSDLCQQSWDKYTTSSHCHLRNWWPLFWHLIDASILFMLVSGACRDATNRKLAGASHTIMESIRYGMLARGIDHASCPTDLTSTGSSLSAPPRM